MNIVCYITPFFFTSNQISCLLITHSFFFSNSNLLFVTSIFLLYSLSHYPIFLVVCTQFHPLVGWLAGWLVHPSIGLLVAVGLEHATYGDQPCFISNFLFIKYPLFSLSKSNLPFNDINLFFLYCLS